MKSLKQYILEQLITEVRQITLDHPKFNNFVVMAGGAASGKGFTQQNINADFRVFDVDELKKKYAKLYKNPSSPNGIWNFKDPEDVSLLHKLVKEKGWKYRERALIGKQAAGASKDRMPNILLDITASDSGDLVEALALVPEGYTTSLIWVVQSIDVAVDQNLQRSRTIQDTMLKKTHNESYKTVLSWLNNPIGERNFDNVFIYLGYNPNYGDFTDVQLKNKVFKLEKKNNKFVLPEDLKKKIDNLRNMEANISKARKSEETRKEEKAKREKARS